ncbi:hypothetical protein AW736_23305 [Termitidicoccus mucosus]|uniref:TonB-dependent receptor plug domain-containing protein n=2 Tax=Termitidicoccus mucosus TaxID=1184151 RepID=A0A178IE31_9BACT|nr:hypothetical protein AW736_23305 [Opitutaceae bacterium TSB47]
MSPFQVDSKKEKGYFAENTLAGSRMKTNIADLGASISVITKQQMEDTASLDINDVFRYEVNTEGSSTYTPGILSARSDGVADTIAANSGGSGIVQTNATANRVRGLGVPGSALNYYPANPQVPFDSYNTASLEISRGPNSMLFGMGSPAGIVNQSTAQALLNKNTAQASFRVDDRASTRASFNFNKSLIKDTLAVYGAFVYNDQQFERKPSYDITRRQYGAITYRPFKKTILRASVEGYTNDNRRPNSMTPRDFVTEWVKGGRPVYDSATGTFTSLDTGAVSAPFAMSARSPRTDATRNYIKSLPGYDPSKWNVVINASDVPESSYNGVAIYGTGAFTNANSILFVPGIASGIPNLGRTVMQIADGNLVAWFTPQAVQYRTQWGKGANPAANADTWPIVAPAYPNAIPADNINGNPVWDAAYNSITTASGGWSAPVDVSGYMYSGVTDKKIYNWEKINTLQMNYGNDRNTNYNLELEQEILPNLLHLSAGWLRQDFDSFSSHTVATLDVNTLYVDTNVRLPDGSLNPYLGQVFVRDQDPEIYVNSETADNYRAMLAFTPDFSKNKNWTKWLGRHQILGLFSYQDVTKTLYRKRPQFVGGDIAGQYRFMNNPQNNADGTPTGWNYQQNALQRQYYLSKPGDPYGTVTQASGEWGRNAYTGDITVYNYATSQWETVSMTTGLVTRSETTGRNQRRLASWSGGITSYWWAERLITTLGIRYDDYRARAIAQEGAAITDPVTKTVISKALTNAEKWVDGVYQIDKVFSRWKPWDELSGTTSTIGGVLKPFQGWEAIESRADRGSLWWEFVRSFGVSYNKSDNFNAPDAAQVDLFGKPLPKPTGEGTDWGVQFSLFKNKLFARVTWFEASNDNERITGGSAITRLKDHLDTTSFRKWARQIALINKFGDPTVANWAGGQTLTPADEQEIQDATATIWQQSYNYYGEIGSPAASQTANAKGVEVQVTYNPLPNWTMKLTGGKQETRYSDVLKEYTAWYAHRSPAWDNARAADYLLPQYQQYANYTTSSGGNVNLANFWGSYGFTPEIGIDRTDGCTNVRNYFNNVVLPQVNTAIDLDGRLAPGQRRFRWAFLTNYVFTQSALKGFAVGGSQRWEDRSVIGYYGRSSGANTLIPNYIDRSDVNRPIYDSANWYTDLWISYTTKIMSGKVRMKLQLNVVDVFEDGGLRPVAVNYDGSVASYRIVDPRTFILSATFDF